MAKPRTLMALAVVTLYGCLGQQPTGSFSCPVTPVSMTDNGLRARTFLMPSDGHLVAGDDQKMMWFTWDDAPLRLIAQRIDAPSEPLTFYLPDAGGAPPRPSRIPHPSGFSLPEAGCWQIARDGDPTDRIVVIVTAPNSAAGH
jgi:hypothetical protein